MFIKNKILNKFFKEPIINCITDSMNKEIKIYFRFWAGWCGLVAFQLNYYEQADLGILLVTRTSSPFI